MIDVQNGKYSFASELSKAKASAPWAALHISSAHAICGLSEINHHMKHTREKKINYICSLIEGCPKKGKFTKRGSLQFLVIFIFIIIMQLKLDEKNSE